MVKPWDKFKACVKCRQPIVECSPQAGHKCGYCTYEENVNHIREKMKEKRQ